MEDIFIYMKNIILILKTMACMTKKLAYVIICMENIILNRYNMK